MKYLILISTVCCTLSSFSAVQKGSSEDTPPAYTKPVTTHLTAVMPEISEMPRGVIQMFAGQEEPVGWLFCDGRSLVRTEYGALFDVIGTVYGGDGRRSFCLPDMRSRFPLGVGVAPDRNFGDQVGVTGGAGIHTLTMDEMPAHTHTASSGWGEKSVHTGLFANAEKGPVYQTISTSSSGEGQPFSVMPPYLGLNFIIKY